ncbi:MAG: methylated-DNA--[protein]-cysteine S-methyltransferase [Chloroflexi bacterium]|nr:MAG: methylated-DNA--[protein]-cysteine S-methyltransferase [Chloroflexota bacterium]TMD81764.1 MAG: methylated-DNA--[protein]-cysteine S-methyltransferase [Chloroflexota bacterium]
MLHSTTHATPVGELTLVASDHGLRAVVWPTSSLKRAGVTGRPHRNPDHPILKSTIRQLDEYFAGERTAFDIAVDLEGTRFQVAAWRSLAQIPFGSTTTYGRQAATLGIPTAARAIGAANGANPVCIVLPCHRVIGSDGSLTGFGGGLEVKQWLLEHEARVLAGGQYSIDSTQWQRRQPLQTRLSMPVA